MKKISLIGCLLIISTLVALYGVNIAAGGTVTQDFDGIGTSATATMPTGWKVDKNTSIRSVGTYSAAVTATELRAGNNMSSTAQNGIYNFGAGPEDTATDRAVGGISSGTASKSVNIYVQLTNNGSSTINNFTISYNVEKYRMGTNSAGFSIQMYYSTDGSTWTSAGSNFLTSFTSDPGSGNAGYASAPGETKYVTNQTLDVSLASGSSLYLAWNYSVTSGTTTSSAQALGIDDVTIVANPEAGVPTISVAPASLTGFSYIASNGPSSEQSFSLTGSNLTSNLTVSIDSDKHFEISSTSGGTFVHSLSYTPSSGSVSATVYVRMKAGLAPGDYNNENIVCASEGATSQYVTCSGTVLETQPPVLHITGTLNKFTMEQGTPSISQSYTLYGENLTEDISITPPSGYQLSQDNINWVSSLSLAPDFSGTISVRLNGTNITSYNGNIVHTSGTAEANLAVSGIVFEPTPDNLLLLDNFYYDTGLALKDTRWTAHSGAGTNSITVQSGNLTYEGYPSIAGNLISLTGSGEDVNRTFTAQTANSVYASFLVNVTSATTTGDYFIHFGINPFNTGLLYGRVYIKSTGTGTFDFGLSKTTDAAVYSGNNYNYGTTYLLVLKYEIVDGTNNDIISLFINPYILGTEPTPIISISPNSADIANIGAIAIRQGAAANAPTLLLDGIRVANSWENLFEISEQPPLPVVLTSFTAIISADNCIILNWTTESENGLVGYYIYRSTNDKLENAQLISQMITANNSSSQCIYTYEDNEVFDTTTYYYWLQSIELGGIANIYGPVSVYYGPLNGYPTPEVPFETVLQPIYPNPFNPIVFIPYTLAEATDLNFYIYNSRGQLIRHFYVGTQEPGYYRLSWDGKDSNGISCANGVYQIVMKAGKNVYTRKAALMK